MNRDAAVARRDVLTAGLATGAGLAALAVAHVARAEGDKGSHAGSHSGDETGGGSAAGKHQALIDAALKCIARGEVCTDHCLTLLGKGDTSLKDCMRLVQAMMASCAALTRLAALDSPRLKDLAKVCADVCEDCEKECRKHEKHHAVCKACAESCKVCLDECRKLT